MSTPELQNLLSRAQALEPQAQYDAALEDLNTVVARAAEAGLTGFRAEALYLRGKILRIKGELEPAALSAGESAELFSSIGDLAGQAQAVLVLAEVSSDQARLAEFEAMCRQAIALSQQAASPLVEARGLTLLGAAHIFLGKVDEAREPIEEAVRIYQAARDRRGIATSLLMLGRVDHMRGDLGAAAASIEAAIGAFEQLGDRRAVAAACFSLGLMDLERGRPEEAKRFAAQGIALTEGTGETPMRLRCLLLQAQADIELRQWDEALSALAAAEDLCLTRDQKSALPEAYRIRAQVLLGLGEVGEAERSARLGRAVVADNDTYSQGTTRLVLALALEPQGRQDEADEEFRKALEHFEESGEPFELGWCHLSYAQFLRSLDWKEQARAHLLRARTAYRSLEAQAKIDLIDDLLRDSA